MQWKITKQSDKSKNKIGTFGLLLLKTTFRRNYKTKKQTKKKELNQFNINTYSYQLLKLS